MKINVRSSYDSFRELRENNAYFVDKTEILSEYLVEKFEKAVLFARPRRFGKTLTMTMFRDFLDIRQKSGELFEGLKIMEYPEVVERYMNQYPVVFLSLKELFGRNDEVIYGNFRRLISKICKSFDELMGSEACKNVDKELLLSLMEQRADEANTIAALDLLTGMLSNHYGKPVFVIIDEYDVPMAKALNTPHYDQVRDMVEHMLSYVCKTNENVKAVMLSGCLFTIKNSTYTGVNNINAYTVLSPIFSTGIGFTDEDVKHLLSDTGLTDYYDLVAEWYDGYIFGREKMYCPWDVLKFVSSVLDGSYEEAMGPESYWVNTSETSLNLIQGFQGKSSEVKEGLEQLLAGKTIVSRISENLPYHRIHESGENLWSVLVETGYLTKAVPQRMQRVPLRIPNRSIRQVFEQEVWTYFKNHTDNAVVNDLENALWSGEVQKAEQSLSLLLEATLSFYHEYHEYSYHLILDGLFTGLGYRVLSETETGYGRSDLLIPDPALDRCMILELKHVKEEGEMEKAVREAAGQIESKHYEARMNYEGYGTRLKYGIAFWEKRVMIERLGYPNR